LLSSGGLLAAHADTSNSGISNQANYQGQGSSQTLALNIAGGVVSAGSQQYSITQSGPALEAIIDGSPLVSSTLTYNLNVYQQGLSTSGSASFQLSGQSGSGKVTVSGKVQVSGSVPGALLPFGCTNNCTSEVPAAFTGSASVRVGSTRETVGMVLESAYFDPFGDAITLTSVDNSIIIVTNYTQATINWNNVVDEGGFYGMLGNTPISGAMQQVAFESENLVAGTAQDSGSIAFSQVTNMTSGAQISYMDASGVYYGTSTIPQAGSFSCGFACTETGFQDSGSFWMLGGQGWGAVLISGSYSTTWTVPAFAFTSSVSGQVSQW